jgi:hypothetical protein
MINDWVETCDDCGLKFGPAGIEQCGRCGVMLIIPESDQSEGDVDDDRCQECNTITGGRIGECCDRCGAIIV